MARPIDVLGRLLQEEEEMEQDWPILFLEAVAAGVEDDAPCLW